MKVLKLGLCLVLLFGFLLVTLQNLVAREWADAAMCLAGVVVSYFTGIAAYAVDANSSVK